MTERDKANDAFARVWKDGMYRGFSKGTSAQDSTPLLTALIDALTQSRANELSVIEGGAGSGDHSITLARQGYRVTAVEYSKHVASNLRERIVHLDDLKITVVQGDVIDYLKSLSVGSCDAFYANSLFHIYTSEDRVVAYKRLQRIQPQGGLIAVSFKAEGDVLQNHGEVISRTEAGVIVHVDDGIDRLFVSNPDTLIREIKLVDYSVSPDNVFRWEVPGYNYDGEIGKFIGFLARKTIKQS